MTTPPATPQPAASLILLRDGAGGEGLELFMIERHTGLRFAPGATVFPGGRLEEADHAPHWRDGWPGHAAPDDLPHRIAAIRETFEECGLLLARGSVDGASLAEMRRRTVAGTPFAESLRRGGMEPAVDRLAPLARWVTPEGLPRRFDALFYLAPAPEGQRPMVDGGEAVAGLWATPRRFLAEGEAGRRRLVFATRLTLLRLARCADVAEALREAEGGPPRPILPRLVETAAGPVFRILADCGFGPAETPAEKVTLG